MYNPIHPSSRQCTDTIHFFFTFKTEHLVHLLANIVSRFRVVANNIAPLPSEEKLGLVLFCRMEMTFFYVWSMEEVLFCVMAPVGYFL